MTSKTPAQLSGLAGRLVADGLLDATTAEQAQHSAASEKIPFVAHLVQNNLISGQTLAEMAAEEFGDQTITEDQLWSEFNGKRPEGKVAARLA